jgi:hypothetical protein
LDGPPRPNDHWIVVWLCIIVLGTAAMGLLPAILEWSL